MALEDISLFQVLKAKLDYTAERQRLIAQNVANADTPGYAPSDLKPFTFETAMKNAVALAPAGQSAIGGLSSTGAPSMGGAGLALTNPGHMVGLSSPPGNWKPLVLPDSEARVDGNQVVLEDQMAKLTEARLDHEAAVTFYQQSLTLLRTAAKAPGK